MSLTKKRVISVAVVALVVLWAGYVTTSAMRTSGTTTLRFSSLGGGPLGGGGGLTKVTTNSPGLLGGSGTSGNPLTASITIGTGLSGTGSSGSALVATTTGDITDVTAGSGLTGGATSGAATLDVGAGSGITVAADTVSTNAGSGLTYSSGALITNAGSGLTYSSGALITNAGSGLTYSSGALITNAGSGLTYSSGALIANVGTGLGFSAGAIVASLTGGTCGAGQVVTAVSSAGVATCSNVATQVNSYDGTHFEWQDDFIANNAATGAGTAFGTGLYACLVSGTSAACGQQNNNGTTTRPGIIDLNSGTTSNKLAMLYTGVNTVDYGSGNWTWECVVGFPTLSDGTNTYAATLGFGDLTTGINHTDGCYFLYDQANVATNGANSGNAHKLECVCGNGTGSPTRTVYLMDGSTTSDESFVTVNAPVAALTLPNTNIYHLKIVMTSTTRAEFYVNGTKSCDINTHISGGSSRLTGSVVMIASSAGATEKLTLDWCRLSVDLTSARSP